MAGVAQILRHHAIIGELEAQIPRDIDQGLVGCEAERSGLPPNPCGEFREALFHGTVHTRQDVMRMAAREVLRQFVRRGLAEKVIQKRHDACGIAGRECSLCVPQRRQIDMTHHILAAGLGRVAFPAGPNCRADTCPAAIKPQSE